MGTSFWVPFIFLEETNRNLGGSSAEEFYSSLDSDLEAPLTGKYWKESTKSFWLGWSFLGSPGYALPPKELANRTKNFGLQFETVRKWIDYNKINEHVLIAGFIGIMFTIFLAKSILSSLPFLNTHSKIAVASFTSFRLLG